jgi:hypothetical protein
VKTKLLLTAVSLVASLIALPFAVLTSSTAANAAGCGGYVNLLQWGCAPWDNNPPKPGVTPGYPATPAKPAAVVVPAAPAGGGNLVASGGGNLIGHDGASVVAAGAGNLIGHDSSSVVAAGAGNLIGHDGASVVAAGAGNLIGHDGASVVAAGAGNLIGHDGASVVAAGAGNLIGHDSSSVVAAGAGNLILRGPSEYRAVAPVNVGPTPEQLAAQKAMSELQTASGKVTTASTAVLNATDKVDQYATQLAAATKANDHQLVALVTGELATAKRQLDDANNSLKSVSDNAKVVAAVTLTHLADQKDIDAATKLIGQTVAVVQQNSDSAKAKVEATNQAIAAAAAPAGPSALQIATANAAAATAATAAKAASDANSGVQALVATLGSRPANTDDLAKVNRAMASSAVETAKADLAKAKSDLVALSAKGASKGDIQSQQDLIAKAQKNLTFQQGMVANDYAGKRIAADSAETDLANAKKVVDGLTKAYGSNRPADPQQNATITAAMVVQALAQDKADKTNADVTAARLIAAGASKNDIQTQLDLSAAKQKDMAGILKVNPQVLAAAGVAGNTDPALVAKAISGVVATAAKQTSTAVQQTTAAVQQANVALQQARMTPAPAPAIGLVTTSATDTAAELISSLKKTSESLSSMSVNKTAVASIAPGLPGPVAASTSTSTTPAATSGSQNPTGGGAPVTAANTSGLTVAGAQQILRAGPGAIQGLQAVQAAAAAKGDKTTADTLGKDIVNYQAQIEAAKKIVASAAPAPPQSNPAVVAAAPTTTVSATPAAAAKMDAAPAKISAEQAKAVQQALKTIPGKLTRADEKSFAALSTMADRAKTKGLTPEEAVYLKEGLAALAEKHPKAEKQSGLTTIGNAVAPAEKLAVAAPVHELGHIDLAKPTQPAGPTPVSHTEQPKAPARGAPVVHTELAKPAVAPKVTSAPATAPKAPTLAAAKPPATPAAKPQTCTPNMVNGKMMGMICH